MSRTRMLIISFWIFIGCMLLWQFYQYDQGLTQEAIEHPKQEHFWFTNSVANAAAPVAPSQQHIDGPNVQQVGFEVQKNTPNSASFTCLVTLKNVGNAKAVGVQVNVRPFRGITMGDVDAGHAKTAQIKDSDPLAQMGTWVTFPDLGPGEASTQSAVFTIQSAYDPGTNPNPEILFQPEKGH
jgi:hypothetical protein